MPKPPSNPFWKGMIPMQPLVTLKIEDDTVRFTPDGRIAVVDAIGALSEAECPDCIWEELKRNHPQISEWCNDYTFAEEETVSVAGSRNWMHIQELLLEHLIDNAT
jgi:hypothetical protein